MFMRAVVVAEKRNPKQMIHFLLTRWGAQNGKCYRSRDTDKTTAVLHEVVSELDIYLVENVAKH